MDPLPEACLQLVMGRGEENPITRKELVWKLSTMGLSVSDRKVRQSISELVKEHPEGAQIVSSSHTAGYWFTEDPDVIAAARAELASRRKELGKREQNMERAEERLRAKVREQGMLF